jgi:hypothetical protein
MTEEFARFKQELHDAFERVNRDKPYPVMHEHDLMTEYDYPGTPFWMILERKAVFFRMNTMREKRGLDPLTVTEYVQKVELPAVGFSDYADRVVHKAAELAFSK